MPGSSPPAPGDEGRELSGAHGLDPESELRELTRMLREHARWQQVLGATGLPAAPSAPAANASFAPIAQRPGSVPKSERGGAPIGVKVPGLSSEERSRSKVVLPGSGEANPGEGAVARRLQVLAGEAASCTRCSLHKTRTNPVFARGTGSSGLCFVGEGPGADEDAQGLPFVGKAGQLLDRMIAAMGVERDAVYVCNIVKCRPPNNRKPEDSEMDACSGYLHQQIELIAPKVIVALGATAVLGLLGLGGGITRLRGNFRLYKGRIPVMPTFHPAYLLRNPEAKREVWEDLQAVMRQLGLTPKPKGTS